MGKIIQGSNQGYKRFLNVNDLCEYTSLCKSTIYQKVSEKAIPFIKINKRVVFDIEQIDPWMLNGGNMTTDLPTIFKH